MSNYMIEKIAIRAYTYEGGMYYKVRKKRELDSDYGIFRTEEQARQQIKRLERKEGIT